MWRTSTAILFAVADLVSRFGRVGKVDYSETDENHPPERLHGAGAARLPAGRLQELDRERSGRRLGYAETRRVPAGSLEQGTQPSLSTSYRALIWSIGQR